MFEHLNYPLLNPLSILTCSSCCSLASKCIYRWIPWCGLPWLRIRLCQIEIPFNEIIGSGNLKNCIAGSNCVLFLTVQGNESSFCGVNLCSLLSCSKVVRLSINPEPLVHWATLGILFTGGSGGLWGRSWGKYRFRELLLCLHRVSTIARDHSY